jgi:membrane-associated protease RseP (regulator of RpoE activity)
MRNQSRNNPTLMAALLGAMLTPAGFARALTTEVAGDKGGAPRKTLELISADLDNLVAQENGWFLLDGIHDGTGISLAKVDDTLRSHLELPEGQGAVVTAVAPESRAARAGLEPKDILLKVGDKPVADPLAFKRVVDEAGDAEVVLHVLRAGKPKTVALPKGKKGELWIWNRVEPRGEYWIGVSVSPVDDTLRSHLELPEGEGLVLTEILPDSPATKAGLKTNDILLKIGGEPLESPAALVDRITKTGEKTVPIEIIRGGKPIVVKVTPEKRPKQQVEVGARGKLDGGPDAVFRFVHPGQVVGAAPNMPKGPLEWKNWAYSHDYNQLMRGQGPQAMMAPPGSNARLEKRLTEVLDELKELRKSVDALRKASKSD